jgi:signal transduction histidine kinase
MFREPIQHRSSDLNATIDILKQSRLFSSFSEKQLKLISPHLTLSHFPVFQEITREGEIKSELFFLISGSVSVYSKGEHILSLKRLGDICGEMCLLTNRPGFSTDIAETDVSMFKVDLETALQRPDVNHDELKELLTNLCSSILADKLAMATMKAGHFEENLKQLKQAVEKSQLADQIRASLLTNISHEIRTPMHGMIGMVDLMLNTKLTKEQQDYLTIIRQSALTLQQVIDDMVNIADLERGGLTIHHELFNPFQLIEKLEWEMRPIAEKKQLTFSIAIAPEIPNLLRGDPVRLHQIMQNLVGNAIKFTHEGHVKIEVSLKSESDEAVRFHFLVNDSGIGIEENHFNILYKPFFQADNSTSKQFGGIGMGLAISKRLVELMGGKIGFETEVNKGSTFWFYIDLPRQKDRRLKHNIMMDGNRESDKNFVLENVASGPARILVVDHDPINRLVAVRGLQGIGCHVEATDSGEKAMQILNLLPFDIIMINVYLPDGDGVKTTAQIRKRPPTALNHSIPILGMASHPGEYSRKQTEFAGFSGLVQKPLTRERLQMAVNQWSPT